MTRAISIVLIVAIALQTVGCSSWRPLARMNAVAEDDSQSSSSIRDQVQWKLKEGMHVRIRIRAGTNASIQGRLIECVIVKFGHASLTVVPFTSFARGNEITLRYADIARIEYRDSGGSEVFVLGLGVGVALGFVLFYWALSGIELD